MPSQPGWGQNPLPPTRSRLRGEIPRVHPGRTDPSLRHRGPEPEESQTGQVQDRSGPSPAARTPGSRPATDREDSLQRFRPAGKSRGGWSVDHPPSTAIEFSRGAPRGVRDDRFAHLLTAISASRRPAAHEIKGIVAALPTEIYAAPGGREAPGSRAGGDPAKPAFRRPRPAAQAAILPTVAGAGVPACTGSPGPPRRSAGSRGSAPPARAWPIPPGPAPRRVRRFAPAGRGPP